MSSHMSLRFGLVPLLLFLVALGSGKAQALQLGELRLHRSEIAYRRAHVAEGGRLLAGECLVLGRTASGETIVADAPVFVGLERDKATIYDLELSEASGWEGVWRGVGPDKREMLTYRMLPNPGRLPDAVLHGGEFVHDEDLNRPVLELSKPYEGVWGLWSNATCNGKHANLTISLKFKAESLEGTQVLYAQGGHGKGYNLYLHDSKLYGGQVTGGNFLSTDKVEAGRWHEATLVLENATESLQDGRLALYLDGTKVATGPGRILPPHHEGPRLGGHRTTSLHTGDNVNSPGFRGRIADFQQINAARPPQ